MKTLNLTLQNIKCDGCVQSITNTMKKHSNINDVLVTKENGNVIIKGDDLNEPVIIEELNKLGYPLAKNNLFKKLFK